MLYAAIDIGTVTTRMLVAEASDDHGHVVLDPLDFEYTITDLGEDVDKTGCLKPEAIERVRDAVRRYLDILYELSHGREARILACATSASRDASNSEDFLEMMRSLGVDVRIIPGSEEGKLSFIGATDGVESERAMVVDVGGGSTEIAIGRVGEAPDVVHSFDMGSRRVTERFLGSDVIEPAQMDAAREWARNMLADWMKRGDHCDVALADMILIAVAGTATSVVSMRDNMEVYDSAAVHGSVVSAEELRDITDRLASMTLAERKRVIGLDPKRAPVIVGGLMILEEVMRAFRQPCFIASESDILQGMIISDMNGTF